jgi:hypothetical protein
MKPMRMRLFGAVSADQTREGSMKGAATDAEAALMK